jgi:hypothetical protein
VSEVCRSCKAPIRWAVTVGGHTMPIDPEPVADGNLRLEHGRQGMVRVVVVPKAYRVQGELLYKPHMGTCPPADQWRKRT